MLTMGLIIRFFAFCSNMINVIVWLCLVTVGQQVHGKVITVNTNGSDSLSCCEYGACMCSSLSKALLCAENNTMINITSQIVSLTTSVSMTTGSGNLNNIIITGNHGTTVMCNNSGAVLCDTCSNVFIEGITWDQCGNISDPYSPGIGFNTVSNISIRNCIFQYSKVCSAVSITDTTGAIDIVNSTFMSNGSPSPCDSYSLKIITSYSTVISILDSIFCQNAGSLYLEYSGKYLQISVNNTNFVSNDIGMDITVWPMVISLITFDTVNVSNNGQGVVVYSYTDYSSLNIISSHFADNHFMALLLHLDDDGVFDLHNTTFNNNTGITLTVYTYNNYAINMSYCSITDNVGNSIVYIDVDSGSTISISQCTFNNNIGDDNILYITMYSEFYVPSYFCNIMISSNFTNNKNGPALQVTNCFLKFSSSILFQNNSAKNGGAIYIGQNSQFTVNDGSTVQFINNTASLRGGAMYIDLTNCYDRGIVFANITNYNSVSFTDNLAKLSGNSIYFDIPESCDVVTDYTNNYSAAYIPFKLTYKCNESRHITGSAIATSPYGIKLCLPESTKRMIDSNDECWVNSGQSNSTENNCVNDAGKIGMLGQSIYFSTTLYDYFNGAAETIMFQVKCDNCESKFKLVGDRTLVHNDLKVKVEFLSDEELKNDTNITLTLTSLLPPEYRPLTATLSLTLSSCYNGFSFSNQSQQCECYIDNADSKLIQCEEDTARIKLGYWFGSFNNVYTLSLCYHEYCNFFNTSYRNETGNGFFNLPRKEDDQCNSHRTGVACGECSEGYTLAYNSPDCISVDKCSPGMTVLVVVLTALYWVAIVAILFGVSYYLNTRQVSLGYLYGMIYFYSVVDILLVTNLHKTDGVFYVTTILSSFAKLNPQFIGKLCFIKDLDAIDQQFIHYCHVVFISITLIGTVIVSKCNKRVFSYIKHLIVPVTCLLLLFSYTSLTSISLLLLIPVKLNGEEHTFLSPREKYFHNQHVAYASVAIFCVLLVAMGFPFLLVINPFMTKVLDEYLKAHVAKKLLRIQSFMKKSMIVRIKPLLDQLQDCYKDQYRWFAAYYLICRLVIMLITYYANDDYNNMIYYLQTACVVITMTHIWIQPYKNDTLNVMDTIILLIMLLIVNLSAIDFSTSVIITGVAISLIIAPLFLLFGVAVKKLCLPMIKKLRSNPDGVELTSVSR